MTAVFGLYLIMGLVKATCQADESSLCGAYVLSEYVIMALIQLSVILAVNFNITSLRALLRHGTSWSGSTAGAYARLLMYLSFRWIFLGYLLLPTVLLILRIAVIGWKFEWASAVIKEFLLFVIYARVAYIFRLATPKAFQRIERAIVSAAGPNVAEDEGGDIIGGGGGGGGGGLDGGGGGAAVGAGGAAAAPAGDGDNDDEHDSAAGSDDDADDDSFDSDFDDDESWEVDDGDQYSGGVDHYADHYDGKDDRGHGDESKGGSGSGGYGCAKGEAGKGEGKEEAGDDDEDDGELEEQA
eukprot:g6051.t1